MFKKATIIAVVLCTFLISSPASAVPVDNTSQLPEFNPFCWHRKDCHSIRKQFLISNPPSCEVGDPSCEALEQGFITTGVAPCAGGIGAEQWGRCLPAGKTKTEISFGGKDEFNNIGDFLVVMYKYLLTIASIVAVVVIIIAGAQWITSGGNSEAISSAKKRIGGAIIGLFIAYMSYFVLNTINPALVNLRLPQVWLVKPQSLMPEFCRDIESAGTIGFQYAASSDEQTKLVTLETVAEEDKKDGFKWTDVNIKPFVCGARFFAEAGGRSTCRGNVCEAETEGEGENAKVNQKTCFDRAGDRKKYECGDARLFGSISNSATLKPCGLLATSLAGAGAKFGLNVTSPWGCPPIPNISIVVVCKDKIPDDEIGSFNFWFGDSSLITGGRYIVESKSSDVEAEVMNRCNNFGGVVGFVVAAEMEKEAGLTDYIPVVAVYNWATDSGPTNAPHLIGRRGEDLGRGGSSGGAYGNLYKVDEKFLIQPEEIMKGYQLDIDANDIRDTSGTTEENKKYWKSQ